MQNDLLPSRLRCLHSQWLDQRKVMQAVWGTRPSLRQLHHRLPGFAAAGGAVVHAVATGTSEAAAAVLAQVRHHDYWILLADLHGQKRLNTVRPAHHL